MNLRFVYSFAHFSSNKDLNLTEIAILLTSPLGIQNLTICTVYDQYLKLSIDSALLFGTTKSLTVSVIGYTSVPVSVSVFDS